MPSKADDVRVTRPEEKSNAELIAILLNSSPDLIDLTEKQVLKQEVRNETVLGSLSSAEAINSTPQLFPVSSDTPRLTDLAVQSNVVRDDSEEGGIPDDMPAPTKRKRSPSTEEQAPSKRSEPSGIKSFRHLRHPNERLPCMISINQHEPIGTLYPATSGFTIMLFIDPGRYGPPSLTIGFRNNGRTSRKDQARVYWDVRDSCRGQWAMHDISHDCAPLNGPDRRISNEDVLKCCNVPDMGRLMYMRFTSWAQACGFFDAQAFSGQNTRIKQDLRGIFKPKKPFTVELWFIAPTKPSDFRKDCLRCLSDPLEYRGDALDDWKDKKGEYFNNTPMLARPEHMDLDGLGRTMLRMNESGGSRRLPTRRPHPSKAQDALTGSDDDDR